MGMNDDRERKENMEKGNRVSKKDPLKVIVIILVGISALLFILCVVLLVSARKEAVSGAAEAYAGSYQEAAENTAQGYYELAFQIAEKNNHVSSRVTLSLGDIQETSALEVLKVSDVEFIVHDEDDFKRWLAIPGQGIFTVDMTKSEFLVDNIRQTVIARLPQPELTLDKVNSKDIEIYDLEKKGSLLNGNYREGATFAQEDIEEGQKKIREYLSQQEHVQEAEDAAKLIIKNLIRSFNPNAENLEVVVEFVN